MDMDMAVGIFGAWPGLMLLLLSLLLLLLLLLSRRSKSLNTIPPNTPYAPPSPSTTCHGSNELYVCECVRECCIVVDVSAGI